MSNNLNKEINKLDDYCKQIKKLRNIMNTIKANGLYSEKEMQRDLDAIDRLKANDDEADAISQGWYIRKQMNNKLIKDANKLMKLLKEEMKNDN